MDYKVVTVAVDELPEGTDWALVREHEAFYLFVKDGRMSAVLFNQTWPAFIHMEHMQPAA